MTFSRRNLLIAGAAAALTALPMIGPEAQTALMNSGVKIELCGATAKANGWGNADLLPGVKINTDAMARTIQLVQQGFVKITE